MSEICSVQSCERGGKEYLTYTLLPGLQVGDKFGHKLTGLERLQVTGLLRLIIDNNRPVTTSLKPSYQLDYHGMILFSENEME